MLRGRCHCGNISFEFDSRLAPPELPVRACRCGFCRVHGALSTSDPDGGLSINVSSPELRRARRAERWTPATVG
ncbi:MAG: hypothetical protein RIC04_04475 [Parvibaculum sp.]|uniref:hypothetical protein n=1 Tax=Parvibaculum sp. TaxID=2024848 RepID=UPI0032EF0BB5